LTAKKDVDNQAVNARRKQILTLKQKKKIFYRQRAKARDARDDLPSHCHARREMSVDDFKPNYVGVLGDASCEYCKALLFPGEKGTGICCEKGQTVLPPVAPPSKSIQKLFTGNNKENKVFKVNIKRINNDLSFASHKANMPKLPNSGPPSLRIQGAVYHRVGPMYPRDGEKPRYMSLYVYDTDHELENRLHRNQNDAVYGVIMKQLQDEINRNNPYVPVFKRAVEELKKGSEELRLVLCAKPEQHKRDPKRYNIPTGDQVGTVMACFEDIDRAAPSNQIRFKDGTLDNISTLNKNYDPMVYVLLFPFGDEGWYKGIPRQHPTKQRPHVSQREHSAYRLMKRSGEFNTAHHSGRLFLQYVEGQYAKVESGRLLYFRANQDTIRADLYRGALDALDDENHDEAGKRFILPPSFIGCPRNLNKNYNDAMAIVDEKGTPELFITVTCNPNCPEVLLSLEPGQEPRERPDIVVRVFNLKLKELKHEIVDKEIFGKVVAFFQAVEFQKRGLPHAQIL